MLSNGWWGSSTCRKSKGGRPDSVGRATCSAKAPNRSGARASVGSSGTSNDRSARSDHGEVTLPSTWRAWPSSDRTVPPTGASGPAAHRLDGHTRVNDSSTRSS